MRSTERLAECFTSLQFEDLPHEVVASAKSIIIDTVGVGLFACQQPWSRIAATVARGSSGPGKATVWGGDCQLTAPYAALANGTAVHGMTIDDDFRHLDNAAATVAAAVAMAEQAERSGRDLILAVVCSYELAARVTRAFNGHVREHFYPTGLWSVLGAAVAAGRLIGLDQEGLVEALGFAGGSAASGLSQFTLDPSGSMVKGLQGGGWPARSGVIAALLAQKGQTAAATILEGEHGVIRTFCSDGEPDMDALTRGLGEQFEILQWEPMDVSTESADGNQPSATMLSANGMLGNPLASEALENKFRTFSRVVLTESQTEGLLGIFRDLDQGESPLNLAIALRGSGQVG